MNNELNIINIIACKVKEHNGFTYFVGGYVRDKIRGIQNDDFDIEIHGITPDILESILDEVGTRIEVGKSFGVYKLKGYDIDFALPRKERLIGVKHQDFEIEIDPFIGVTEAARRRDFTINAIYQDVLTLDFIDPFNGINDIKNKVLRCVDKTSFIEDPLRVLRGAQFASRFEYEFDKKTLTLCKSINLTNLSKERVFDEVTKALLKAEKPSIFFNTLRQMNQLSYWFKEVEDLIGVLQPPMYHMEGDVWNHTMMSLDNAVKVLDNVSNKKYFMYSILCHDLGKPYTFTCENNIIHFLGHEEKGVEISKSFLNRLTSEKELIKYVENMTLLHMRPNFLLYENAGNKAYYKLFDLSINSADLILVAYVDAISSINGNNDQYNNSLLYKHLDEYNVLMSEPSISGQDLIDNGIKEGKNLKVLLDYAHKLKLSGLKKDEILKSTLAYAKQNNLY